jgi:hypothetical protein
MGLFDGQPLELSPSFTAKPIGWQKAGITYKDLKGRAYRRRPYWMDVGKAAEGLTCKTCRWLVRYQRAKTYMKCGLWKITGGPGTQIASTDHACRFYGKEGMPMFTIKRSD